MAKPTAANRLAASQAELAATDRQIVELGEKRNNALLRDDDAAASKLLVELERIQRLARGHADKIALLTSAAEREAQERRVKEKSALIGRVEAKLAARDKVAAELAAAIKLSDELFRRWIDVADEVQTAWPWQAHDLAPTLLGTASILEALQFEIHRVGSRPALLGGQKEPHGRHAGWGYPGGRSPRIELAGRPDQIPPLVDAVAVATRLASDIMRKGISTSNLTDADRPAPVVSAGNGAAAAAVEPAAAAPQPNGNPLDSTGAAFRERSPAEAQLGALLAEMARLADDVSPEGERRYVEVSNRVAEAQDALNREKGLTS
jgi:hypothetical protein